MQLPPQLRSDRRQFLLDYFFKFPTYSIRKAQKALKESKFGPATMRTAKIAAIKAEARAELEAMPANQANAEGKMRLAEEKLATDIETELYKSVVETPQFVGLATVQQPQGVVS